VLHKSERRQLPLDHQAPVLGAIESSVSCCPVDVRYTNPTRFDLSCRGDDLLIDLGDGTTLRLDLCPQRCADSTPEGAAGLELPLRGLESLQCRFPCLGLRPAFLIEQPTAETLVWSRRGTLE
jgi:hypothetical protein